MGLTGLKSGGQQTAFLLEALTGLFPCLDPFASFWRMPLASGPFLHLQSLEYFTFDTFFPVPIITSFSLATAMTFSNFRTLVVTSPHLKVLITSEMSFGHEDNISTGSQN